MLRVAGDDTLREHPQMPTLFRFLAAMIALAGLVIGTAMILANTVEPESREITIAIPHTRFNK
jgi:hypothetical protein